MDVYLVMTISNTNEETIEGVNSAWSSAEKAIDHIENTLHLTRKPENPRIFKYSWAEWENTTTDEDGFENTVTAYISIMPVDEFNIDDFERYE